MGFAPFGNSELSVWRDKSTLHEDAHKLDFGKRLDAAMHTLFEWCAANGVPIMAHSNRSNGPYEDFEHLAGADYWAKALSRFPDLKICFGHFGDTDTVDHKGERTLEFIKLMTSDITAPGRYAYGDSSFFADALTQPNKLRETLSSLFNSDRTGVFAERFLYGSDWEMLLTQNDADSFLERFIDLMNWLDTSGTRPVRGVKISEAFFGWNAVEYLGLQRGQPNRDRLQKFYKKHGLKDPDWMIKVDRRS